MRRTSTESPTERARSTAAAVVGLVVLAVLAVGVPEGALAQGEETAAGEPIATQRPASLVVAPTSFQVYLSNGKTKRAAAGKQNAAKASSERADDRAGVGRAFGRGAARYAANHSGIFDFVSRADLRQKLRQQPLFDSQLELAEDWAEMGIDSYKRLETGQAVQQLEKAVEQYDKIQYHQVEPKRVAQVLMYLSLSYLSEGTNAARPLVLMKRMIRLDPQRVLRRGYYPDDLVNFYRSARNDVLRELQAEGPNLGRARRLAEVAGADLVAYGFVLDGGEGARARVWMYSKRQDALVGPETIRLPEEADDSVLRAAGNRLMGRFAGCIHRPAEPSGGTIMNSGGKSPISVHLDFAYMSWLKFPEPLEQPFGNVGLGFGADLKLTEEFGLGVGIQVVNSLRDYIGLLQEDFSTLRVFAGPDLGVNIGRVNIGARISMEGTHVGAIQVCRDLNQVPLGCPEPHRESFEELDFMLGINAQPRVQVRLIDAMRLTAGASISYYFVPFSGRTLGYPLTGVAGVSYRF